MDLTERTARLRSQSQLPQRTINPIFDWFNVRLAQKLIDPMVHFYHFSNRIKDTMSISQFIKMAILTILYSSKRTIIPMYNIDQG